MINACFFEIPGKKVLIGFALLFLCHVAVGQVKPKPNTKAKEEKITPKTKEEAKAKEEKQEKEVKDSMRIYKRLKKIASKNKYSSMAFDAIFVDPAPKEYPKQPASNEDKNVNPYLKYTGRIIRRVNVIVYDPFGYSVTDTVQHPINRVQKLGNDIHIKTRKFLVINRLLFKPNQPVEALKLSESERVLRELVYVNDARVYITETKSKDSVDVNVIVHDKWPIEIPITVTDISANIRFRNNNLFGVGQQFQQYAGYHRPNTFDYNGSYNIANIDNTFISSNISYQTTLDGTKADLVFDRPFYSPLATWAGGVDISRGWLYYGYYDTVGTDQSKRVSLDNLYCDVWTGRNIKLSKDTSLFNQSTNMEVGIRYYQNRYQSRPPLRVDQGLQNTTAIIGNVGFTVQQFYKDKYIYRFGANEDVPEGFIMQLIYGGLKRELLKLRYYTGIELGRAKHFDIGYLSSTFSYGIFFNKHVPNDVTVNYKIAYFTDLLRQGKWYFRQFADFNIVHGENKAGGEVITVSSDELYGFNNNNTLYGKSKMVLNSETVAYMPYNLAGFRVAPVFLAGLAMLGDPQHPMLQSRLYQGYSLGFMFRNENLLTSTFQFTFGFYPFLPNGQGNVLKYNPVGSFTLKVRGFFAARPEFVSYN